MKRSLHNQETSSLEERKKDHIKLAFEAQVHSLNQDKRFNYEPLFAPHPNDLDISIEFLGKKLSTPIWVSSMTGGTKEAFKINKNLARACKKFGMGMGLGSCRPILEDNTRLQDFNWREEIGHDLPFYANIGIAQLELLIKKSETFKIEQLVQKLNADGIIIHINPLQEWLQPEGDHLKQSAITTIKTFLNITSLKVIVKEVGQGMGPKSVKALIQLPLEAIEFAAFGGTNFSKLELLRADKQKKEIYRNLTQVGHPAEEMVNYTNTIIDEIGKDKRLCRNFIISGGIQNFLDGYYLNRKLKANSIYGQASSLLKYAAESYDALDEYLTYQVEGYKMASSFLTIKN